MPAAESPRRRRRDTVNEIVTIYWRDIPAQVNATVDGARGSWLLDERFQVAIDRAATVAELTNADQYVRQWRRSSGPCSGDPEQAARAAAEDLERRYDAARLGELVRNGGLEPRATASTRHESASGRQP